VCWLYGTLTLSDFIIFTSSLTVNSSHASWKVMKFKKGIFQAWKVMKNDWSWKVIEKSWNSTNRSWNFFDRRIIIFTCDACVSYAEARNSYRLDVRLSVRLSIRLSHAGTLSKRLNILSCFLHHTIAHSF